MDAVSWSTVTYSALISVGVSVLVTLAADLFARPRLEARKEDILERHRARRQFRGLVRRVTVSASALAQPVPTGLDTRQREVFVNELQLQRGLVVQASREMQDRMADFALYERRWLRRPLALMTGEVRGIAIADHSDQVAGGRIFSVVSPVLDYLDTSPMRLWKRRSYRRKVIAQLEAASP